MQGFVDGPLDHGLAVVNVLQGTGNHDASQGHWILGWQVGDLGMAVDGGFSLVRGAGLGGCWHGLVGLLQQKM